MRNVLPVTALLLVLASPAFAQQHPGRHPTPAPAPTPAAPAKEAAEPTPADADALPAMDWPTELPPGDAPTEGTDSTSGMPGMEGMDHSAHGDDAGDEEVGDAPPPPVPTDHPADAIFGEAAMRPSRDTLAKEHGGMPTWKVMIDQAEWRARGGEDGFGWKGEAWYGGDENRVVVKSEGSATDGNLDDAETQLLYSRAVTPYFDVQAGVRQDARGGPDRTYATLGFEGLAPYWFETEGALLLSNKGESFARLEGSYDLRLTQRLILQPRAEANFSGQDIPELKLGSGLTELGLDLRLRYEFKREFAPYVGVSFDRKLGGTADYAKALGEDDSETSFVVGVRAWF